MDDQIASARVCVATSQIDDASKRSLLFVLSEADRIEASHIELIGRMHEMTAMHVAQLRDFLGVFLLFVVMIAWEVFIT